MTAPAHPSMKRPLNPGPGRACVTGFRPGIQVRGLGRDQVPVADWLCACGCHERARGRAAVTAVLARAEVGHCPHVADTAAPPNQEGAKGAARQGVLSAFPSAPLPDTAPAPGPERRNAA
ncbi:hypothetical protein [Streptomyces sp. NPDC058657]|uniref:hypothetical protein n=1 Tax=unclassified Streptomyces TaxID=2593676 RepID=UPI00365179D8